MWRQEETFPKSCHDGDRNGPKIQESVWGNNEGRKWAEHLNDIHKAAPQREELYLVIVFWT